MPELSRFYGITISIFSEVGERHHTPHFHATYQEWRASFSIEDIEVLAGELPRKHRRLVEAWAEIHQSELIEAWRRLQTGESVERIEPLN